MFFSKHKIGDISFITESDIFLKYFLNKSFQKFSYSGPNSDIYQRILMIENKDLILPPLVQKDQDRLLQCNLQSQLGPGFFILPPLILKKNLDDSNNTHFLPNHSVNSLLRSQKVRERLEICFDHPKLVSLMIHKDSVVIYDYHLHTVDLFYRFDQEWIFKEVSLENGFRRMFASFLPSFSALMLHSSGIILNNRTALFFAQDEGGKSTVIKKMGEGIILCDDRNIIRYENKIYNVHSTPWGQINNGPKNAPLGGLFFIEKAQDFEIIPFNPREAILFLWKEHMSFWQLLPRYLRIKSFDIISDICHKVPCHKMRFPKNYVNWKAIDEVLKNY